MIIIKTIDLLLFFIINLEIDIPNSHLMKFSYWLPIKDWMLSNKIRKNSVST